MVFLINKKSGFTLIELLVVISIIGLLSSVTLAAVQDARNKTKDKALYESALQLRTALELYKENNNGVYPGELDNPDLFYVGYMKSSGGTVNTSSYTPTFNYTAFSNMMQPYIKEKLLHSPYTNVWFYYAHDGPGNYKCAGQTNTPRYILLIQPRESMGLPGYSLNGVVSTTYRCISAPE